MENQVTNFAVMRIFISSTDKYKDKLLYEHITFMAKEYGIAGATVLKGILGYGASSVINSYKFWEISEKLPVVVEMIDAEDRLNSFYETIRPNLESMRYGCLVTMEKINILLHKSGKKSV